MNLVRKLFFTKLLLSLRIRGIYDELKIPYKLCIEDGIPNNISDNLRKYQNLRLRSEDYLFAATDPECNMVVVFVDQFKKVGYDADINIGAMDWLIRSKLIHENQHVLQFEYLKLRGGVRALNNLFQCERFYAYGNSPIELNATYAEQNMRNFYDMRFLDCYLY
jgi:hypothetical protein